MTKWRPLGDIQVKVIGICIDQNRLLAMDVHSDRGKVKGVRPLGGHIEFGETRETALRREFQEELGTAVDIGDDWFTFENIYMHHGKMGHEFVFAVETLLLDTDLLKKEIIAFSEDSGTQNTARWHDLDSLRSGKVELFPSRLIEIL